MPTYRFQYVCETSLQHNGDVPLEYAGNKVVFLFSQKNAEENTARVRVDVEAPDHRAADLKAQSFLQPVLDAVSFSTGSPLLGQHWDLILKGETGSKARKAIWCEKWKQPAPLLFTQQAINEAQQILAHDRDSALELCWHRYALQRNLILDRFVFQWLSFEGLAGKKQIATICPNCNTEVTHCEKPLLHQASDGDRAYELFSRVEPSISPTEFKKEVWGRTRNAVFHGSKYPSPEFLLRLNSLSPKLRAACNLELNQLYELGKQPRPNQDLELHVYRTNMFEWQTAKPENEFADDFPWEIVNKEFGNMKPGEVRARFPEASPLKLLDLNTTSKNW